MSCDTSGDALNSIPMGQAFPGLHDAVERHLLDFGPSDGRSRRALDLGSGPGGMAVRLLRQGYDVLAADIDVSRIPPQVTSQTVDLDSPDFASLLPGSFDLVLAVEVIEHLESPIGFLRNCRNLLASGGRLVITTPNVENLLTRMKYLYRARLRQMDELADPTHISPIHWDILVHRLLPRVGLRVRRHVVFPESGFAVGHARNRVPIWVLSNLFRTPPNAGEIHIIELEKDDSAPIVPGGPYRKRP